MTTSTTPVRPGWHRRFPGRWARERQAFRDLGWEHSVRYVDGAVEVHVRYPLPDGGAADSETARLKIVYPRQSYPAWMPVEVFDLHDDLGVTRHRDPTRKGLLCLVHEEDHDPTWTAADLLAAQLPKLIASNIMTAEDRQEAPSGLELPVAEPMTAYSAAPRRVVVPHVNIPQSVTGGALVLRQRVDRSGNIVTSIVDQILGPGLNIQNTNVDVLDSFPVVVTGWWLRLPAWDPAETAGQLWHRISPLLPPMETVRANDPLTFEADQQMLSIVGLLVEDERTYGESGPCWMFLVRARLATGTDEQERYATVLLAGQEVDDSSMARTPIATGLADKKVALIGVGAIGHHIATDLARTGVGGLDLVDFDYVDVGTQSRTLAPASHAGMSKSAALAEHLRATTTAGEINSWDINATTLFEHSDDLEREANRRRVLKRLSEADLIIDPTANATVTSVLNAVTHGRAPMLVVAGTPGLWGGWVALTRPGETGCWECVGLHRADGTAPDGSAWPVPPADPDGWVSPVSCSQQTFTGSNGDVGTVAHQASRTAIHYLAQGVLLGGDYYVASLRDSGGPVPVTWQAIDLCVHPSCQNHPVQRP